MSTRFNPRPRVGATGVWERITSAVGVSIRAPVWGRPETCSGLGSRSRFNPRPRVGATRVVRGDIKIARVSIRAPVWGRRGRGK